MLSQGSLPCSHEVARRSIPELDRAKINHTYTNTHQKMHTICTKSHIIHIHELSYTLQSPASVRRFEAEPFRRFHAYGWFV